MTRIVLLLLVCAPAIGAAQERWERWERQVEGRLQRAISALNPSTAVPLVKRSGTINKEEAASFDATLTEGVSYTVVGVCDDDCARLQLALTTTSGSDLAKDRSSENFPTLRFTPTRTMTYRIRVVMEECRVSPCWYAVGVVPQGSAP